MIETIIDSTGRPEGIMQAKELDLRELLSFSPEGGVMHFMGQRVLLFDAVALGLLRRELIESLGPAAARSTLTRFGYAHGRRTAESLKAEFPSLFADSWSGPKLHMLHGMLSVEESVRSDGSGTDPLVESFWHDSYEAEQHLLHLGQSDEPVCWTLAGFASGYVSYWAGREVYFIEDRCCGKGDAVCHIEGRFKEEWGEALEPHLPYFHSEPGDVVFRKLTQALQEAEKRLKKRQNLLSWHDDEFDGSCITARSKAMRHAVDLARRIAKVESSVIVTGESGVGKERIARLIHNESARAGRPFVAVNCGALTETLLESELFGHAKGSFTGADRDSMGLVEAANGGTLFLDEIGEISQGMQVKLLRVLQEREVRRVGENKSRQVNIRVVAATNRNLADEVANGRFRQDLYYRLKVIELRVPSLRERSEDILPLARIFLEDASCRAGRKVTSFTPQAVDQLQRYRWPGNVRELQNAVEHAVALCSGSRADLGDLPEELRSALPRPTVTDSIRPLEEVEREYILAALRATGNNKARTAAELNIGIATLYRKLSEYEKQGRLV
jgi:two-component system response regulator HydG